MFLRYTPEVHPMLTDLDSSLSCSFMTIPLQQGFGFHPDIDSSIIYNGKREGNVNVTRSYRPHF